MLVIQRLLEGKTPSREEIERFLDEQRIPVVEGREATFVFHGRADHVNLRHFIYGLPSVQPFHRVDGTDLWYLTLEIPEKSRIEYKIERTIGLQIIAGDVAGTPGNGGINVTDAVAGALTVTLQPVESAKLSSRPNAFYDIKLVTAAGAVSVLTADRFNITSVTTEAVA